MKNNPIIDVPASKAEKVIHTLSILLIMISTIYVLVSFKDLPDTIPIHFNAKGEEDGWGGKGSIFIMPIISIFSFFLLYFLSKAPHMFNYMVKVTEENAPRLYPIARLMMAVMNFMISIIFSFLAWETVQAARGVSVIGIWFLVVVLVVPLAVIILFIVWMNRVK